MDIPQPTLKTARLTLDTFKAEDIADIFGYASDPEVARFVTWDASTTLADSRAFLDYVKEKTNTAQGSLFFVFAIRFEGHLIGSIDFKNAHPFAGQLDYVLSRRFWGKGFMTEAATALRDWSFAALPEMVRLQAYCIQENTGSSRVMEKIGMKFEGTRLKSMVVKGEIRDISHYALIR